MRRNLAILTIGTLALTLALPALARNHGTTPGLEGPAHGRATVPAPSTKPSPGINNPTTAPTAPIGSTGPVPDAPGRNTTAPGLQSPTGPAMQTTPSSPTGVAPGSKR